MNININEELESAHKQYIEDRKGVILDLINLSNALLNYQLMNKPIDSETSKEFRNIISRTCEFIIEGEV